MARTRSTARKSAGGVHSRAQLRSSLSGAGSPDLLALLTQWLASMVMVLATRALESDTQLFKRIPYLRTLCAAFAAPPRQVLRTIAARLDGAGDASEQESNARNLVLQDAVSAYIARHCTLDAEEMHYELTDDPSTSDQVRQRDSSTADAWGDNGNDSSSGCLALTLTPQLARPTNRWVSLTPEVEFQDIHCGSVVHFQFRATASQAIDAFLDRAYAEHEKREAEKARAATERYHYERIASNKAQQCIRGVTGLGRGRGRGRSRGRGRGRGFRSSFGGGHAPVATRPQAIQTCRRYRLTDATTFASLFFDAKTALKQTLDAFARREGKFAPRRFAHRLGVFVHGPSGSGKTSVAKAIAHYTQRHIVNIQASRLKTNREVADLLQDLNYAVPSLGTTVELDFKDVVLVLEGIDELAFASPTAAAAPSSYASRYHGISSADHDKDSDKTDRLTLHGFLTALDGMVDTPQRLIVMTATDVRRVDPALVRPGRVHCTVDLRRMSLTAARDMIAHYVSRTPLESAQLAQLEAIAGEGIGDNVVRVCRWTPAELEALCLESHDVDAVLRELSRWAAGADE